MQVLAIVLIFAITVLGECGRVSPNCDERYMALYKLKGCQPVFEEGNMCPFRYDCPVTSYKSYDECVYNGRSYQIGEKIDTINPCRKCYCAYDYNGAFIKCPGSSECGENFSPSLPKGCYHIYEEDKCCATASRCRNDTAHDDEKVCHYGGKTYYYGERIHPQKEAPCQICSCNDQWSGIGGSSCKTLSCEIDLKKFSKYGCLPIFHEGTCCPIEGFCGDGYDGTLNYTVSTATRRDYVSGKTCVFRGVHYKLGQSLNYDHPTHCVTCSCITPPDFTCIHKTCYSPTIDQLPNCNRTRARGECCATYTCKPEDGSSDYAP